MNQDVLEQFCAITGTTDRRHALSMMDACGGNLEMAIGMQMESQASLPRTTNNPSASRIVPVDVEEIRAPIPQKREVLVEHDPHVIKRRRAGNPTSVFDRFRDFQSEARQQEQQLRGQKSAHQTKLEDLFRPPLDLLHRGTFASAQAVGTQENKWILVNIQNTTEFGCQVLNRDIWKDSTVKSLVKSHFVLWQVYHDSVEGQKYTQFYPVSEWPYVAILHPVTTELQKQWTNIELKSFIADLRAYIKTYSKPDGTAGSATDQTTEATASPAKVRIIDSSEDSQLEAAIQASLREAERAADLQFESDSELSQSASDSDDNSGVANGHKPDKGKQPVKAPRSKKTSHTPNDNDNTIGVSERTPTPKPDSWKDHCSDQGSPVHIVFRKPDQARWSFETTNRTSIKALLLIIAEAGFPSDKYELVAQLPYRNLSQMDSLCTLEQANFQKQEILHIRER